MANTLITGAAIYPLSEIYGQLVFLGFVVCHICRSDGDLYQDRLERCRAGLCYCNSDVCDCCCDRWLYLFCREMEQSPCVAPQNARVPHSIRTGHKCIMGLLLSCVEDWWRCE